MTQETLKAYQDYMELGAQIKALTDLRNNAKAIIKGYHAETDLQTINENGFKSMIVPETRRSLDQAKLEKKFGKDAIADCWTETKTTNFKVYRVVNG